ncbi:MAG: SDR family oxidoreductase [Planctomycetaceae bacterium]|jgi:thioester reductase-like protein|nr:SDR family oxidoreductase [Planctomycetaceae bacterium]
MKYITLTGATGLLGSYLMRNLLAADVPLAALVRSSRRESARQRIENTLHPFEKQLGRPLPRPIVLESDLCKPMLGLGKDDLSWMRNNVDTMLHNAASLSFVAEPNGEPYRSNIEGTQNVLALCEATGIRRFHHVSTAYTCGLREGTIRETEFDCGQEFGNDYEKSKFASEKSVREASFLDSLTIFRPAIIVGDSLTGFTPTFHGFYAPLKILTPLVSPESVQPENAAEFGQILGMKPDDVKNYVPVNWIAEVMTHVIRDESLHRSCYHLASKNRTRMDVMSRIMAEGIQNHKTGKTINAEHINLEKLFATFIEQMEVYKSYWRCDPIFDMTNTHNAVPHLPPPIVDEPMLRRLVRYAITSNFGWPIPKPASIPFDTAEYIKTNFKTTISHQEKPLIFGLRVTGLGGGDWTVNAVTKEFQSGLPTTPAPLMTLNSTVFQRLVNKTIPPETNIAELTSWERGNDKERQAALQILTDF